ncbi:MAG: regulatory protein RecX [Spirochaetales bacterium]|nr:regulatory protein RecX [Spirochaetales bacterium]
MEYSVQEGGSVSGVLKVLLEDGSSFFIAKDLLYGDEAPQTPEDLEFLAAETGARKKALDLLARRDHARGELRIKLLQRNFDPAAVEKALEWIDFKGYLNDERFARRWIEERLRKHPEGLLALEAGLRKKGIDSQVIRRVLGGVTEAERLDALERAREKISRRHDDPAKVKAALMRRGFGSADFRLENN